VSRIYYLLFIILTLNSLPLVILSEAKNLMVLRAGPVKGKNLAPALTLRVTKSFKGLLTYSHDIKPT